MCDLLDVFRETNMLPPMAYANSLQLPIVLPVEHSCTSIYRMWSKNNYKAHLGHSCEVKWLYQTQSKKLWITLSFFAYNPIQAVQASFSLSFFFLTVKGGKKKTTAMAFNKSRTLLLKLWIKSLLFFWPHSQAFFL